MFGSFHDPLPLRLDRSPEPVIFELDTYRSLITKPVKPYGNLAPFHFTMPRDRIAP